MSDWFYLVGTEQRGPVAGSELKLHFEEQILPPNTWVWREGMDDWVLAATVPELIPPAPPPPRPAATRTFS